MRSFRNFLALLPAAALVLAACGGGDDGGTNPPPPVGGFTVSLSPTTLSVQQGASGTVTATIARTGSFAGTVNLTTENVPAGITATFNPAAIAAGTTSTTLTAAVGAAVAPGSYTFTIRGQATGLSDQTATVSMTVTARPAIAVALAPASASVAAGGNTSFTATVTPTNFTGTTSVAITGAPTGVTTTVTTNGNTHTVAVAVGAATAPGTYQLTATATGTGVTAATANFALTVTAAASGSIALSASPSTVNATAGGASVTSTVTITRTNFTGDVTLAASQLPAGATAAFNPTPTSGTTSTLTLTFAANTAAGTYPITVTGTGTGITAASTQVMATVAAAPASTIALSATPTSASIAQGASTTTTINIARTNFTGAVNLAVSGAPAGVTPTLSSSSTTGNSATLTLAAGSSTTPGTYTITVTGTGTGVANATTTFALTVTQASSGGNIVLTFCGPSRDIPIWLAAQNGSGPWTAVTAGANNTWSFSVTSTGGVAWVTQNGTNDYDLTIQYGTAAELGAVGTGCVNPNNPNTKTVNGTVAGLGATDQPFINFGGYGPTTPPSAGSPSFTITGVPDGPRDLLGARVGISLSNPLAGFTVNKVFIRRDLNPANNGSVGTVDFNGTDAFDPDQKTVTISGGGSGEQFSGTATFVTANQSAVTLGLGLPGTSNTVTYAAVPSSRTRAGDLHILTAQGVTITNNLPVAYRAIVTMARDATNTSVTLGPALSTTTVSTVGTAGSHARLRTQFARQNEYGNMWLVGYSQGASGLARSTTVIMTSGYLGSAGTVDLTVPDFTGVGSWQNLWGIQTGTQVSWTTTANGWVIGGGNQAEGTQSRTAARIGTHNP